MRARFSPEREYLLESARGLVSFVQKGFPVEYYQWHNINEIKELLRQYPIYTDEMEPKKITTANALLKNYPSRVEKRRYGKAHVI